MINNFEEQTKPLNETEEKAIPHIVKLFGQEDVLTSDELNAYLKKKLGIDFGGPRIRKMIHHIRVRQLVPNLVASNKGYSIEDDPIKIKHYVIGLRQRASAITEVADSYRIAA